MNAHQQEIENLIENMENDRTRQQDNLKRRLQERRRQRMDALQRKHEREEAREVLEQQKELKDVQANNVSLHTFFFITSKCSLQSSEIRFKVRSDDSIVSDLIDWLI
jgi:flagellar biosynthesis GTPase FlhF